MSLAVNYRIYSRSSNLFLYHVLRLCLTCSNSSSILLLYYLSTDPSDRFHYLGTY